MARAGGRMLKPFYEDFHKLTEENLMMQYREANAFCKVLVPAHEIMYKKVDGTELFAPNPAIRNKTVYWWLHRFLPYIQKLLNNLLEHRENLLIEIQRRGLTPPD
jgi:hypothetical protein